MAEELWENVKVLPEPVIQKVTHENVYRFFAADNIAQAGGRDKATVGALRKLATGVDTAEVSLPGSDARIQGSVDRPVTAADVWASLTQDPELLTTEPAE